MNCLPEPYKIKVVEKIALISREEREKLLKEAGYNLFNIPAEKIYIDLLTDSGTSAMSDNQWAGIMTGDESYAGSKNYFNLEETIKDIFGYRFVIPTHQGRAAENLLYSTLVKAGDTVPNNIHFDTTRANIEYYKGIAEDLVIRDAYDTEIEIPFKGNMDVSKLENLIKNTGVENIPLIVMTITNNSGGGQPVSMENIKQVSNVARKYDIPFFLDACRFAENCYFIKKREKGFAEKTIKEIAREIFSYADGCIVSAKKDGLVNIGGFLALNDEELAGKLKNLLILKEGFPTYGGLAGRDLEALARGLKEVLNEDYLRFRVFQIEYMGRLLADADVPVFKPYGGHALFLNARTFLPHIPQERFPAQALTVALYREAGIRAVEIGGVMFAKKDSKTGEIKYPELELVRLAVPRRVYTNSHLHYVAESIRAIYQKKEAIKGMKIVYEAPYLRHFTVRFNEVL